MRLGKIKKNLEKVLAENKTIQIQSEQKFGGQAYLVKNYLDILNVLEFVSEKKWVDFDKEALNNFSNQFNKINNLEIPLEQFNQLNNFVNKANGKIPVYYSILETMVEKQEEQVINVKLSKNINSLNDLTEINKRLEKIFKKFNIDGEFTFKGFDKGTEWYILVSLGQLSYLFIIACLKISQEYFKARTEYFNSENARLSYEASLEENDKPSEKGFDNFQKKWLEIFVKKEVCKAINEIKNLMAIQNKNYIVNL